MKRKYLILALALTACGEKQIPQDGTVKFTADGQSYTFDGMQFEIQPNALNGFAAVAAHKEITSIKKGKNDFGFWIRNTQVSEQKQRDANKDLHANWRTLEFHWFAEAENPIEY